MMSLSKKISIRIKRTNENDDGPISNDTTSIKSIHCSIDDSLPCTTTNTKKKKKKDRTKSLSSSPSPSLLSCIVTNRRRRSNKEKKHEQEGEEVRCTVLSVLRKKRLPHFRHKTIHNQQQETNNPSIKIHPKN
mmetsp:Transcript_19716/g.22191  ORF Transcript_19716/g.22191 Transcript_19716/m.22191 type:complete len:133 (+) Transcript_19716:143-541(+)